MWIVSPIVDFIFVFGGVTIALFFKIFPQDQTSMAFIIALATLILSGAHMLAPFLLILASKKERERVMKLDPKFWSRIALIAALPFLLYGLSATLFQFSSTAGSAYIPIAVMGCIWVLWNAWHFGIQQFGLMQIYRTRAGLASMRSRKFDSRMATLYGCVVPTVITIQAGVQDKFLRNFVQHSVWLEPIVQPLFWILVVSALATMIYLRLSRSGNLPIYLLYLSMFIQSILLLNLAFFNLMIAVIVTHWLQEIFLIGHIYAQEHRAQFNNGKRNLFMTIVGVLLVLAVSGVVDWIQHIPTIRKYRITVSGGFNHWSTVTPEFFWTITMAFAAIMSFAILHFYIDRLVHRGRRW